MERKRHDTHGRCVLGRVNFFKASSRLACNKFLLSGLDIRSTQGSVNNFGADHELLTFTVNSLYIFVTMFYPTFASV